MRTVEAKSGYEVLVLTLTEPTRGYLSRRERSRELVHL